jgi:outer membrane receptor protein involved in Fe transport
MWAGGTVSSGYPELAPIKQTWREWTGRIGLDWKPELGFTDDTMLYAFYSRGYKGGGANPPSPGFATGEEFLANALADGVNPLGSGPINLRFEASKWRRYRVRADAAGSIATRKAARA